MPTFPKSQLDALGFDFPSAVEAHRQALLAHRAEVGVPAPAAPHPLVEAAVTRVSLSDEAAKENGGDDFVADYVVIDDTPPPPTLDQSKDALAAQVMVARDAAIADFLPPRKRPLIEMKWREAMAVKAEDRTREQNDLLADHAATLATVSNIESRAVHVVADIDDLTEDNIGAWVMPNLASEG